MNKRNLAAIPLLLAAFACARSAGPADPYAGMTGEFARGDAELRVESIDESPMGRSVDFQLSYADDKGSGTIFGAAEEKGANAYRYEIESLGVKSMVDLSFDDGAWTVAYSEKSPKKKKYFDYSGTYKKK